MRPPLAQALKVLVGCRLLDIHAPTARQIRRQTWYNLLQDHNTPSLQIYLYTAIRTPRPAPSHIPLVPQARRIARLLLHAEVRRLDELDEPVRRAGARAVGRAHRDEDRALGGVHEAHVRALDDLHELARRDRADLDERGREEQHVLARVRVRRRLRLPPQEPRRAARHAVPVDVAPELCARRVRSAWCGDKGRRTVEDDEELVARDFDEPERLGARGALLEQLHGLVGLAEVGDDGDILAGGVEAARDGQ